MPHTVADLLGPGDSSSLRAFEKLREEAASILATRSSSTDFLDIRTERRRLAEIVQVGNSLDRQTNHEDTGAFVRVLIDGRWGSAWASPSAGLERAVDEAMELARMSRGARVGLAAAEAVRGVFDPPVIEPLHDVTMREKAFLCKRYSELLASSMKELSTRVHYREVVRERAVVNSFGSDILERHNLCGIRMEAVGGEHKTHSSRDIAYRGGFEFVRHREDLVEQMIESLRDRDTDRVADPGTYTVVIDPQLAGILVHEAFGHISEADFLLANPVIADAVRPGRKVSIEGLTIVDDSTHFGLPGSCAYDDEAVPGQRTELVSKGRIRQRLQSLETAGVLGEKSTGNARALDFMHPPSVRMTCTYVEAGRTPLEELLKKMDRGLYLRGSLGGATNMSRFSFTAEEAFFVSNGKVHHPLRPVTITGRIFDVLAAIVGIGDEMQLCSNIGGCSKGEQRFIPVSYGGPHLLLEDMEIS
jgi:TldD protein